MIDIKKHYKVHSQIEPYTPKDWKKKYPEFLISELPGPAAIEKRDVQPGEKTVFDYADDEYIVVDRSSSVKEFVYWGGGFGLIYLFSLFYLGIPKIIFEDFWIFIVDSLLFGLPSLWCFALALWVPKEKKIIFDRMRGLVQLPGSFWDTNHLIRFKELHAVIAMRSRAGGLDLMACRNRSFVDKYLAGAILMPMGFGKPLQAWSFWIWYMDRNRPLPPSEALDPYREKDYLRREKEGFPEPLHPSLIETPEHNTDDFFYMNKKNEKTLGSAGISFHNLKVRRGEIEDNEKKEQLDSSEYYNNLH